MKYDIVIEKMNDILFMRDIIGSNYLLECYEQMVNELEIHITGKYKDSQKELTIERSKTKRGPGDGERKLEM